MIVPGSQSQVLSARLARETRRELCRVSYQDFPDGEQIIELESNVEDRRVTVVASTPTDKSLIELQQILDAVGPANTVSLVIPYMGYSRQDKKFEEGQPVSARAVARGLSATHAPLDQLYTINIHERDVLDWFSIDQKTDIDASTVLSEGLDTDDVVLAPDAGARSLARNVAEDADCSWDYLEKTRISGDEVEVEAKELSVEGRDVAIVDDMIATGSTMSETVEVLRKQSPSSVSLRCIHPVLAGNAVTKLYSAGVNEVVATDTLETALSTVSAASAIAHEIDQSG